MIFVFLGLVAGFGGLLAIVSHFLISTFLISSPCNKLVVSFSGESSDSDYGESGERESQNVFFSSVQSKSWNQCLHPIKRPNLEKKFAHIYIRDIFQLWKEKRAKQLERRRGSVLIRRSPPRCGCSPHRVAYMRQEFVKFHFSLKLCLLIQIQEHTVLLRQKVAPCSE